MDCAIRSSFTFLPISRRKMPEFSSLFRRKFSPFFLFFAIICISKIKSSIYTLIIFVFFWTFFSNVCVIFRVIVYYSVHNFKRRKNAKKIHARWRGFLPELTAHCGLIPDRQRSDHPHPSCSCKSFLCASFPFFCLYYIPARRYFQRKICYIFVNSV